jgi:TRAP-type C4-dicarboxylate transport system substrate-binding protein
MTTTSRTLRAISWASAGAGLLLCSSALAADVTLKASHQFPAGDVRDEMVQIIAKEVETANVGLKVRVYPAASLFKPNQQWDAMVHGQLDISVVPPDYAGGEHPQFNATLMPGLVKNYEHARRLDGSAFMDDIKKIMGKAGVMILSDAWLDGGFASKSGCIVEPKDAQGKVMRAAGPAFEQMLAAAGASISSMPSSEIYTGLQTGVLDAVATSSASLVSFRIYER